MLLSDLPLAALTLNVIVFAAIAAAIIILALLGGIAKARNTRDRGRAEDPVPSDAYVVQSSLFTPAERSFLGVLETVLPDGAALASKVRLADVFKVRSGLDRSTWQRAFNRITAKHVDFLIVGKADGRPLLGIELDDASHNREDRKERDGVVEAVFSTSGLPLLRIPVRAAYDPRDFSRQISACLKGA